MYETAKKARNALKSKARSMAEGTSGKVDSSDWTPPEPLNAPIKTGMRPISRRAYKSGGKVSGECGPMRADRKPRKLGGRADKAEAVEIAKAKVNRNVKAANEQREGIKHVGALKRGGRAGKDDGGGVISGAMKRIKNWATNVPEGYGQKPDKNPRPVDTTPSVSAEDRGKMDALVKKYGSGEEGLKRGGAAKKAYGGASKGAQKMIEAAQEQSGVSSSRMQFQPTTSRLSKAAGLKKGGKVSEMEWEHSKKDLEQDKKLAKKHGMSMEKWEKSALDKKHDKQQSTEGLKSGGKADKKWIQGAIKHPGALHKSLHVPEGEKIPEKKLEKAAHSKNPTLAKRARLAETLGRMNRKSGGRTKGKTNINIVIAGGKPQDGGAPMPPGGKPPGLPAGVPLPMGPGAGAGAPPMPMGAPPMPPGPPAGGPPTPPPGMMMGRKAGGRITKKASSYEDMEAGAGGGEGRLQKTDIAKRHAGAPTRATGGRTYRSYKDMDAGAGSGEGRLEKAEIQHSKRVR